MEIVQKKQELRKQILQKRNCLFAEDISLKSARIVDYLKQMPILTKAQMIMAYLPFASEVDVAILFPYLWQQGKTVLVPVCDNEKKSVMYACRYQQGDPLQKDHYGIWEPVNKKVVLPVDIDFILVPGVAFDKKYHRLGYGGGYYDLFLSQTRKETQKIGLAYAMQITEELPVRCEDIAMDGVITEDGLL